jgi:hypothetical protein
MPQRLFTRQTRIGEPVIVGDRRILPISRSYRISIPAISGGIIWNHPVAIAVDRDGELRQVIPVHDATRIAQIQLITGSLILVTVLWTILRIFGKK